AAASATRSALVRVLPGSLGGISRTLIRLSFQLCDFLLTDEALDFIHAAKVPVTVFVLKNVLSTYSWHRPACDVSIPELVGAFGQFMIVCHFMPLSSFAIAAKHW
ncbi:MAG: hypothetical protein WCE74_05175, partial [Pseudolabrys sp.]